MRRVLQRAPILLVLLPLGMLLLPVVAQAALRPGGGQSFSGSSSSGSSGSSGGGGGGGDSPSFGDIIDIVFFCIECPQIGIPLVVGGLVYGVARTVIESKKTDWSTQNANNTATQPVAATRGIRPSRLQRIRRIDPDFSIVLFEDFLYTLYTYVQTARPRGQLSTVAAYLAAAVQQDLGRDSSLETVSGIVIGAMRFISVQHAKLGDPAPVEVVADFESNLTETRRGQPIRYFVVDRLTLGRCQGVKSRPPARSRILDCPNCGAPLQSVEGDLCSFCKQHVGHGRFDWMVTSWRRITSETRPPLLTSDVDEKGTELPTVVDPGARERLAALSQRDPSFAWDPFQARVHLTFDELQVASSNRDWIRARPFVTDNLFQSQMYWIKLYIEQHARNVTDNAHIQNIELANVVTDKYFDALTVRVSASSLDYTVSDDGSLLSGSRSEVRAYTEYWTFVRGVGRTGHPTKTTTDCPNCGAPLKISMVGNCEHCNAKVTSGEFDWVLSRIEQDDSYTG